MNRVKPSVNDTRELLSNEHYRNFYKQKMELQSNYDKRLFDFSPNDRKSTKDWFMAEGIEKYREYLRKLSDIMLQPDSHYQKFTWDMISEQEQLIMRRRTKSRRGKGEY